jgi:hypothetical protein
MKEGRRWREGEGKRWREVMKAEREGKKDQTEEKRENGANVI